MTTSTFLFPILQFHEFLNKPFIPLVISTVSGVNLSLLVPPHEGTTDTILHDSALEYLLTSLDPPITDRKTPTR